MAIAERSERNQQLVARVKSALEASQSLNASIGFSIDQDGIRRVNGYWYAFLKRPNNEIRRVQVWDLLAEVETLTNADDQKPYLHIAEDLAD
jgi:hypothetical protein